MRDIQHPLKIFLILLAFIFLVELSIMYMLAIVEDKPTVDWKEAILDATLLTGLCIPFFWYFVTRPLKHALELESLKSHKILEMAAEGIVSIDTEGKLLSLNQAAQKIFGFGEEEVIGKNVSMLMPPPHRENHDNYLSRYLLTGEAHAIGKTMELEGRRKDGIAFPLELSISEIKYGNAHFFTAVMRDISEQKLALKRIEQLAHYDELTHLPNRSLFYDRLRQAISQAKRSKSSIALFYIDLDGFKKVNDTKGHHIGDLLLKQTAERLRLCVRESDTLARIGGDEFTVLLNDAHEREHVEMMANKIINSIDQTFNLEGLTARIGASIGISRYPDDAQTVGTLLIVADKAMYAAKAAGKNTFRFGSSGDSTGVYSIPKRV
ncbi:MAG: diguanylate cyclase [Gallionella sp.]|nr:diguanylate cyclase [Gallionella sp.]